MGALIILPMNWPIILTYCVYLSEGLDHIADELAHHFDLLCIPEWGRGLDHIADELAHHFDLPCIPEWGP